MGQHWRVLIVEILEHMRRAYEPTQRNTSSGLVTNGECEYSEYSIVLYSIVWSMENEREKIEEMESMVCALEGVLQ